MVIAPADTTGISHGSGDRPPFGLYFFICYFYKNKTSVLCQTPISQLNIHVVFVVKKRENVLLPHFKTRLCEYLSGSLRNQKHFPLAVNGWYDHIHLFFEMHPTQALSDIVRDLKSGSSKWINNEKFLPGNFNWQDGYGGFSYSRSQRDDVIKYVVNQENHHKKITFREEYLKMLKSFDIDFKEQYLFEFFD